MWLGRQGCSGRVMAVVGFQSIVLHFQIFHFIWMKVRGNWQPEGVWCSHINLNLFQISEDKNVTTSEVKLTAGPEDNGKNITCRAENTQMSSSPLAAKEASLRLDVMCKFKFKFHSSRHHHLKFKYSIWTSSRILFPIFSTIMIRKKKSFQKSCRFRNLKLKAFFWI